MSVLPPSPGLPSGTVGLRRRRGRPIDPARLGHALAALGGLALTWSLLSALEGALAWGWRWSLPVGLAHALVMGLGVSPWLAVVAAASASQSAAWAPAAPPAVAHRVPAWIGALGLALAVLGSHRQVAVLAAGLAVSALGLALVAGRWLLAWLDARSVAGPGQAASGPLGALAAGLGLLAACTWAGAVALALDLLPAVRVALLVALWVGTAGVVCVAVHLQRPPSGLGWWSGTSALRLCLWALLLHGLLAAGEAWQGARSPGWPLAVRAGLDLGAGLGLMGLAFAGGLRMALARRVAAEDEADPPTPLQPDTGRPIAWPSFMVAWIGVALVLDGWGHTLGLTGLPLSEAADVLGQAAGQAFTVGALGSGFWAVVAGPARRRPAPWAPAGLWRGPGAAALCWQAGTAGLVLAALFPGHKGPWLSLALPLLGLAAVTGWAAQAGPPTLPPPVSPPADPSAR